jgi:hypothetical protein
MLIWLGKQMLGQTDKIEQTQEIKAEVREITYQAQWGGTSESSGNEGNS